MQKKVPNVTYEPFDVFCLQARLPSSEIYPAVGLIEQVIHAGKFVLELSPSTTPCGRRVTESIRGKSAEVLRSFLRAALGLFGRQK